MSFDLSGGIELCSWESLPESPASLCCPCAMAQLFGVYFHLSSSELMSWFLLPMPNPKILLTLDSSSHNSLLTLPHYVTSNTFLFLSETHFSHLGHWNWVRCDACLLKKIEMWGMSLEKNPKSKILRPADSHKVSTFLKPLKNSHLKGIFMQWT